MTETAKYAAKPLPDLADPITARFWVATRKQQLTVPRCASCRYLLWPPEIVCPECYNATFEWEDVPTTGTLWSYAIYCSALDPAFANDLPYVVGLVDLVPGVKMYGLVLGDPDELEIGRRVEAVFDSVTDDVTLVRWRLA